tara:strand:- start:176 stop:460 length:285 start_codon:yes stop_codon:yes gene_type:complete
MSKNQIKKEDLETLQGHVNTQSKALHDIGALENQKFHLLHALNKVQQKTEDFKKELEESYGKINIDVSSGKYEPIKEEEEKAEVEAPLVDEYIS